MKKTKMGKISKVQIATLIISMLPVIVYGIVYNQLPDKLPSQFGFDSAVNGYSTKEQFWLMAFLPLFLTAMLTILPKIDPKKENYKKFSQFYQLFALVMALFIGTVFILNIYVTFTQEYFLMGKVVMVLMAILFITLGNYMPQIKPNFFMGIRTPWTLSSEIVWVKTHRIAGVAFVIMGVIFGASMFFAEYMEAVILCTVIPIVTVVQGMSLYYYAKEQKNQE